MTIVVDSAILATIHIVIGLLVIIFPSFLRLIVGVYFLLSGLLFLLLAL